MKVVAALVFWVAAVSVCATPISLKFNSTVGKERTYTQLVGEICARVGVKISSKDAGKDSAFDIHLKMISGKPLWAALGPPVDRDGHSIDNKLSTCPTNLDDLKDLGFFTKDLRTTAAKKAKGWIRAGWLWCLRGALACAYSLVLVLFFFCVCV